MRLDMSANNIVNGLSLEELDELIDTARAQKRMIHSFARSLPPKTNERMIDYIRRMQAMRPDMSLSNFRDMWYLNQEKTK